MLAVAGARRQREFSTTVFDIRPASRENRREMSESPTRKKNSNGGAPAMTPAETRAAFAQIVKREGGDEAVALRLGCSRNMVYRLCVAPDNKDACDPGMHLGRGIQELFDLPMDGWVAAPAIETVKKIVK